MSHNNDKYSNQHRLSTLLRPFVQDHLGIYSAPMPSSESEQSAEKALRQRVAAQRYDNYLTTIAQNHSISVMDREVERFLTKMPRQALILDIGGCWGWHWRRLATRADVSVVIVDFVHANLLHALNVLGPLVGRQVALMHADATALPFLKSNDSSFGFDGVWTVQVFQHIPDFAQACREAQRVLKPGGRFINYSLYGTPFNRALYSMLRREFHLEGLVKDGSFVLTRANDGQREIMESVFGGRVTDRYTECLFHPDLRLAFTGKLGSAIGRLDTYLSDLPWLGRWIARQRSFEVVKD
jgi:ubiquinone/menaquinone biosynthesis C-methylase UbiE